jgi:plasmid stability protein
MIATKGKPMAQLIVRNIEKTVKEKLQKRAAEAGHSMEEEVRDILRDAVKGDGTPEKGLGTRIAERFRGIGLKEPIQELRGFTIEPIKFDE